MQGLRRILYDVGHADVRVHRVMRNPRLEIGDMSLEYLLTTGAFVIAFLVVLTLLMDALVGSMAIKSFLFSLPVG